MIRCSIAGPILSLVLATACTDFDTPSELSREQIVAIRSTPAALVPGMRGQLEALVAGPDGIVLDGELSWSLAAPYTGASIETDGDGAAWLAIETGAPRGSVQLSLTVNMPSGRVADALKDVPIEEAARANPGPVTIEAGGQPLAGDELRVAPDAVVPLRADLDGAETAQVSWYATVGEIELYRRNPTELVAPEDPADGWLIAVARDGQGGVDWAVTPLLVEP